MIYPELFILCNLQEQSYVVIFILFFANENNKEASSSNLQFSATLKIFWCPALRRLLLVIYDLNLLILEIKRVSLLMSQTTDHIQETKQDNL